MVGSSSSKAGCLVGMSKDEPHIFVVTSDGEFLTYKIDLYHGGEGRLENQYPYFPLSLGLWAGLTVVCWIRPMRNRGHLRLELCFGMIPH